MMKKNREYLAFQFLRTYLKPFSLLEMKKVLEACGIRADKDETRLFLESSPHVLSLTDGTYVTKAGAFTGEIFSMMPTGAEAEQGVLVPGDRCLPFIESERILSTLTFFANGKQIPSKRGTFETDDAIDLFMFFGEEYANQYIASDPANEDLNLAEREFELPSRIGLTGIDLGYLERNYGYKLGDRILCCVSDWDKGYINVMVVHSSDNRFNLGEVGEKRLEWFDYAEEKLLECFDLHGPLASIEDQLVDFFYDNRKKLCVPYCGSLQELMRKTRKVGFQNYGVETRLWRKDEDVPAFGQWNNDVFELTEQAKSEMSYTDFVVSMFPDSALDAFVMDCFYSKSDDVCQRFFEYVEQKPETMSDAMVSSIALSLKNKSSILSRDYNWFRDQGIGEIRHKAVELFKDVFLLSKKIDYTGRSISEFPQQELIILSQISSHILQMMDNIAMEKDAEDYREAMIASLDGMQWNFENISVVLDEALAKAERSQFKILRQTSE